MAEAEVNALKEALHNQSLIIKELHAELEEERKASASGTDEALAVIMRLQEEKAIENMEASQYKRMTEEKIRHAEDSLSYFKEALFQKEMESLCLNYELQELKNRLFSLGFDNVTYEKIMANGSSWLRSRSAFTRKTSFSRHISLPAVRFEELVSEMEITDNSSLLPNGYASLPPEGLDATKINSWSHESESALLDVKGKSKLLQPEQLKEGETTINKLQTYSITELVDIGGDEASTPELKGDTLKRTKLSTLLNAKGIRNTPSHAFDAWKRSKLRSMNNPVFRTRSEGDAAFSIRLQGIQEDQDFHDNYDSSGTSSSKLGDNHLATNQETIALASSTGEFQSLNDSYSQLSSQFEKTSVASPVPLENQVSQVIDEIKQLKRWMQNIELNIRTTRQEQCRRETEQLKLLSRIAEQLDIIGPQSRKSIIRDHCHEDESLVTYFAEAMLSFWL